MAVKSCITLYVLCFVDMQLVVICCREMEDRCHLINALDRYRIKAPPVDLSDVKSYLQQHFTVANVAGQGSAVKAASCVDPERLLQDHYCTVCLKKPQNFTFKYLSQKSTHFNNF